MSGRKKLIEVALPLDAINVASAREKSIRHGHPSTLHLWWARRPLAACRAVLFAQLVDDPSSHPDRFPTEEAQDAERTRLFEIIEDLVKWENSTNEEVLTRARAEIVASCDGDPPPILDPFAGGGSIPLEAQRLGLEAHASDLNPVAVLINKALIEIPPRFAGQAPVHPKAENRTTWRGAEGLAEDVRRYGTWMRDEAEARIGHLYPKATLPDGTRANVIAWIWARTVTCPNPACGATMPLVSSFWLGKKPGKEAWIQPVIEGKAVRFEIGHSASGPPDPPKVGRGAKFRCLVCGEVAGDDHVHAALDTGRGDAQMIAIAARRGGDRMYLPPTDEQIAAATVSRPSQVPDAECRGTFASNAQGRRYGFRGFSDYYTNRQLMALTTFAQLVNDVHKLIEADAGSASKEPSRRRDYANAVTTYLAFAVAKLADYCSSLSTWNISRELIRSALGEKNVQMAWDFAEVNALNTTTGSFQAMVTWVVKSVAVLPTNCRSAVVAQADARNSRQVAVIATDPPYYNNVAYADLADYFYVWHRRTLREVHPNLFPTVLTPKDAELTADVYNHPSSTAEAEQYFESGFIDVLGRARQLHLPRYPMTLFYAFKQTDKTVGGGVASTGWSTILQGLLNSGWMVTATWPLRTERTGRSVSIGRNALASSVVLACRPRPETAAITDRQGLVRALHEELPPALHELQKAAIAPVDLRQAAIGPGMAVFSRFAKVVEPDGSGMRVHTALGLINQVLDAVLSEQQSEFDAETRWATAWFAQHYFEPGPYPVAESLSVAMNVSVAGMQRSGILRSRSGKVQLIAPSDLDDRWDPTTDARTPVWEATHQLVKRLDEGGELAAAELLVQLGGVGDSCRALAYRLYTICETPRPTLAGLYNALAASWIEMQKLGQAAPRPSAPVAEQQTFDLGER